jgi:hypothetical protein
MANERQRVIVGRIDKNYNEVPAQYSSLTHKRRAQRYPFSGCSLERWHKMEDQEIE